MEIKNLRDKTDITVNGRKYFISAIPATKAQRMLLAGFAAFKSFFGGGGLSAFPAELLTELNSYAGAYNCNGGEVQFLDDDITDDMIGGNLMDLIEVQVALVEKNFGFFGDGRLSAAVERLTKVLAPGSDTSSAGTSTP